MDIPISAADWGGRLSSLCWMACASSHRYGSLRQCRWPPLPLLALFVPREQCRRGLLLVHTTSGHISKFKHDRLPYTGHAAQFASTKSLAAKGHGMAARWYEISARVSVQDGHRGCCILCKPRAIKGQQTRPLAPVQVGRIERSLWRPLYRQIPNPSTCFWLIPPRFCITRSTTRFSHSFALIISL